MNLIIGAGLLLASPAQAKDGLQFTINGDQAYGHTLAIAPVEGPAVSALEAAGFAVTADALLVGDLYRESLDGVGEGMEEIELVAGPGTSLEYTGGGALLRGAGCVEAGLSLPEGAYYGAGYALDDSALDSDADCHTGETDSDGLCDAIDLKVDGGGGLCGTFDGGAERSGGKGDFVFGSVVYGEARAAGGGGFLDGQTVYMEAKVSGPAGKGVISAELDSEQCHVGVFDDGGLVFATRAPCAEIGAVSDPGGDAEREIPLDQHIALVWHPERQEWVTQVTWTWTGGAIDVTYHLPGEAWIE